MLTKKPFKKGFTTGAGAYRAIGGGGASLALDGSAHNNNSSNSNAVTLSTSGTNRIIVVSMLTNAGLPTGVADTAGLTWTRLASQTGTGDIEVWWALAAAQLTSDVITVSYPGSGFNTVDAFGVSGANTGAPFDGVAVKGTTDPQLISTSVADTFIFGAFRMGATSNPTAGSGFTLISGANFSAAEYKIVSATQTNLSVGLTTGTGDANGVIAAAIKA